MRGYLGLGVAVLLGTGALLWFFGRGPRAGDPCPPSGPCGGDLECHDGRCAISRGKPCRASEQCVTRHCEQGRCDDVPAIGLACTTACAEGLECKQQLCRGRPGSAGCGGDEHCVGSLCHEGRCIEGRSAGQACEPSRPCERQLECTELAGSSFCQIPDQGSCTHDLTCRSLACEAGHCGAASDRCPALPFDKFCRQLCAGRGKICVRDTCVSPLLPDAADEKLRDAAMSLCRDG